MKILLVEQNEIFSAELAAYLKFQGFVTHIENNGTDGHFEGEENNYDAILLSSNLPDGNGVMILDNWYKANFNKPVIILAEKYDKKEMLKCFELGADDYILKSACKEEITARLKAIIRRYKTNHAVNPKYGKISLDVAAGRVKIDDEYAKLTKTEFLILQYLFMNQGRPVSVSEIVEHVYDDFDNDSGIIARHIANIRKKIGYEIIRTEANRGYYVPYNDE
jgi:two-component system OmpR family response regulator